MPKIGNFFRSLGGQLAGQQNSGAVMAPSFNQEMTDTGNQMLSQQGLAPYSPLMSPYFNNDAVQAHPQLTGALGGAMGVLANMGPTPEVSGFGAGLSNVARGIQGNMLMQRQFQMQQAMMPMQIAQQVAEYRKSMAPEAIKTDAGIVNRNPMTGALTPGPTMQQISTGNYGTASGANDVNSTVESMLPPDADPETRARAHAIGQTAAQMWDINKRQEYIMQGMNQIFNDRRQRQEFTVRQNEVEAQHQIANEMHQQTLQLAQDKWMQDRNDLRPEAVNSRMQIGSLVQSLQDLRNRLAPMKGQNWPGAFTIERAKYAMGMAPKGGVLDGVGVAEAAMSQVKGGAFWMKQAGSRNYQLFEQAQGHIFDPWKDSPDNALDKIDNLLRDMTNTYNEAGVLGTKHNVNPTQMMPNGNIVDGSGASVNFNPTVPPGVGPNAPTPQIKIHRDGKGRIIGVE